MRTEVKIGIGVAIVLVVVVVAYVAFGRGGDKPAENAAGNRVAMGNTAGNSSGLNYANNTGYGTGYNNSGYSNATWGGGYYNNASNTSNTSNNAVRDDIWGNFSNRGTGYYNASNNGASNNDSRSSWGNYSSNNTANNTSWGNASWNNASSSNNRASNNSGNNGGWSVWGNYGSSNTAGNGTGNWSGNRSGNEPAIDQARTYTVKASDSSGFWGIAALPEVYGDGKHYKLLEEANKGVDSRTLQVGTVLKVPPLPARTGVGTSRDGEGVVTVQTGGAKVYTVVEGDTLWRIAEKTLGSGTKVDALKKANPGLTDNIKPGQKITLPTNATVTPGTGTTTPRTGAGTGGTTNTNRAPADTDQPARPRFR